jgi:phytoene/squalene synthetase
MIALHDTVQRFQIPAQPFLDLIYAREQDQLVKRYRTFAQLLHHCRYAASPVGHLLLQLQECYHADTVRRMDCLCTGLQLTYFWQNVQRDGQADRVYLPEEDRRAAGYADEDLHAQRTTPAFTTLLHFEAERARDFLLRGLPLIDIVPPLLQPEIDRAVHEGMALLDCMAALGYDAWKCRPMLPAWTRARLRLQTWWRRLFVSARDGVKRTGA